MASVVSRNIFDLLAEEPEAAVKEKEPPAKEPVVASKKVDKSRAQPKEARIRFEYPQRGGHKAPASNRSEDTRSAAPRDRNVGPRLSGRQEGGGGGSGGSGGGGGGGDYPTRNSRGARPNDRGRGSRGNKRGREHDRHSGTGKYDSEKKENQAWGNATNSWENDDTTESKGWSENKNKKSDSTWENTNNNNSDSWGGNDTTENNSNWGTTTTTTTEDKGGATDNWNVTEEPTENSNWQEPQPTDSSDLWASGEMENKSETKKEDTAAGNSAPAPEPEEIVKTYDEYLAEKAQKSLDISLPEFRKPNEGADDSQWKHAVPLEKDEEDEYFTGKEQSYRNKSKKSKTKNYLEITQTFIERPGGGSSRGRGRGRGGRGGRGGRDDREGRDGRIYDDNNRDNRDNRRRGGSGRGVNLDDQRAFPSLGAS